MFGGPLELPQKPPLKPRRPPELQDNLIVNAQPYHYGHYAREPNTDYKKKMLHYHQRQTAQDKAGIGVEAKRLANECYTLQFHRHTDKKRFRQQIHTRVAAKLKEYDAQAELKKDKLRDLLAKDEREFYRDTVDEMQKGKEYKLAAITEKLDNLKAKKEADRLAVVHEKKIQQYMDKCVELRPYMAKKHLEESKKVQLQQIRENESRRQSEKEWDKMWEDVMNRDMEARIEREKQDAIDLYNRQKFQKECLDLQVKGKELLKQEEERNTREDRIEMDKMQEQMRRDELELLKEERRKRNKFVTELNEQVKQQEKIVAARVQAEKAVDEALNYLSKLEYEKEKMQAASKVRIAYKEMLQYQAHLKEMERNRKEDERRYEELLEEHRLFLQKKQDDARCKMFAAKDKLKQDVLDGRAAQLKYKKQEAEEQLRMKQAENELLQMAFDTNQRLAEESARQYAEAAQEYRNDLQKQIEYSNLLRERERQDLERRIELGRREEALYHKHVQDILAGECILGKKHPFRSLLEQYDCHCPSVKPKY